MYINEFVVDTSYSIKNPVRKGENIGILCEEDTFV